MNSVNKYYVYGIYDGDNICRYIGKGKGKRVKDHFTNSSNKLLRECIDRNYTYKILFNSLTEQEALSKEIELIKLYGRLDKNNGTLFNETWGGDGYGRTGYEYDENSVKVYKNRRVFDLENIQTGEIKHFESLGLAAKYIGTSKQNILSLLDKKNRYVKKVWKLVDYNPVHKGSQAFTIKNIQTGAVYNFNSQVECANFIKTDPSNIGNLKKKKINNIKRVWVLPETKNIIILPKGREPGKPNSKLYKSGRVYDNVNKKWCIFKSQKEFAKKYNIPNGDVCSLIKGKLNTIKSGRFSLIPKIKGGKVYDNLEKKWIYYFLQKELATKCNCTKNMVEALLGKRCKTIQKRYSLVPLNTN